MIVQDVPMEIESNLIVFLIKRVDAFVWEHDDMTGIRQKVIEPDSMMI